MRGIVTRAAFLSGLSMQAAFTHCGGMKSKKIFRAVGLSLFFFLVLATNLHAYQIRGEFSGQLTHVPTSPFDGPVFNLGLAVGDQFSGNFSYDSIAVPYVVYDFNVQFQNLSLTASNLAMDVHLLDSFANWFDITGELPGGLFMSVGLWGGDPILTDISPPTYLSSSDWFLSSFHISHIDTAAIDIGCCHPGFAYTEDSRGHFPDNFSLHTVPEPSAMLLLGVGLFGLAVWRRRKSGA